MIIYRKEKDFWDFWEIHLFFPTFGKWEEATDISEHMLFYGIDLKTKIIYEKDPVSRGFVFQVLGFGFSIHRQKGY